ncbi:acyltransferase family protein [Lachnospiraceae bacterium 46-15]
MKDENGRLNVLKQRSKELDICKALLIILVVIGHANVDTRIIKIIFWFHMPVFFYLSGYLLHLPRKSEWKNWAIKKAKRLLIPCLFFWVLCTFIDGNLTAGSFAAFVWGGKRQGGVYWFVTVLFLAELFMSVIELHISSSKIKIMIYAGCYCSAILESTLMIPSDYVLMPDWMKFPWNVDVVPLAIGYLAMGYYGKEQITNWMREGFVGKRMLLTGASIIIFIVFAYAYWEGKFDYRMDMKYSLYPNFVFPLLFPIVAGIILLEMSLILAKMKGVSSVVAYIGMATMSVMYLHVLIIGQIVKRFMGENYSIFWGVIIVLCLSCLFHYIINKNKWLSLLFEGK